MISSRRRPETDADDGYAKYGRSIAISQHNQGADTSASSQWEPESMRVGTILHYITAGEQGVTLVELLVVIGIIALLTGILVPCIDKARSITKRTVCLSNLHSAAIAFGMYLDDNSRIMPPAARYPSLGLNDKRPIAEFLKPFIGDLKALRCPADDGHRRAGRTERHFETEGSSYEYLDTLGGKRATGGSNPSRPA